MNIELSKPGLIFVLGLLVGFVGSVAFVTATFIPKPIEKSEPPVPSCSIAEPHKEMVNEYQTAPYIGKNQTVLPTWEGGPESFYRDDNIGHKCWYENTWKGVGHQYIFAFYCWKEGDGENIYYENDPTPHPI